MPVYEFRCRSCGKVDEWFIRAPTKEIKCYYCGGELERIPSVSNVKVVNGTPVFYPKGDKK